MIARADRLIEQADACTNVADWHEEQSTAGPPEWRRLQENAARDFRVVALTLYLVAQSELEDEEE